MITINDIFEIKVHPQSNAYRSIGFKWKNIWKIPEFAVLEKCEQNPKWHGEGNVKNHTELVCKYAVQWVKNYASTYDREYDIFNIARDFGEYETPYLEPSTYNKALTLLTAALFHDIGKSVTTNKGKDGNWHSYNHENEGEKITRVMLWDERVSFREDVCSLIKYHMCPLNLFDRKDYIEQIIKIAYNIPSWELLLALKMCDLEGSIQKDEVLKERDRKILDEIVSITQQIKFYNHVTCNSPSFFYDRIKSSKYYLEKQTKQPLNLIIMIGLPGSGKDTFINERLIISNKDDEDYFSLPDMSRVVSSIILPRCIKTIKKNDAAVICRDDIRVKLGFCKEGEKVVCTSKQENAVTEEFKNQLFEAAREGKTIIVNNTNLKKDYRTEFARLLSNYLVHITYIYVEASEFSKNVERRKNEINEETMKKIAMKFEWPDFDEYDDFYYVRT